MLTESLFFSAVLFVIGVVGVLTRRNAIIIFMCVELMLNAVNLTFVAFAQAVRRGRAGVRVLRDDRGGGRSGGRAGDHHRALPPPADGESPEHQPAEGLMLLTSAASAPAGAHIRSRRPPPSGCGCVPLLPLLGFVINGALSLVGARIHRGERSVGRATATRGEAAAAHAADGGGRRRRPASSAAPLRGRDEHRRAGRARALVPALGGDLLAMRGGGAWSAVHPALLQLDAGRRPADRRRVPARPALDGDDARRHRRRHADPHLQRRLHARRPRLSAVLRVPEPVRLLHAACWCSAPTIR